MKFLFLIFLGSFSCTALAQNSSELSCKSRAKEIAVQTYSSCMTEARNSQIDSIRKNYKNDLSALKAKYDRELKKMVPVAKNKVKKGAPSVQELQATSAPAAAQGVAKALPTRATTPEAAPIQMTTEGVSVVPAEANDSDRVDVIELPADAASGT